MKKFVGYLGAGIIVTVFVAGFVAYFITSFDPAVHTWYDGFGRSLSESPWLVRFIFDENRLWPGWGWFIADMVIFWGGVGLGFSLANYGFKD